MCKHLSLHFSEPVAPEFARTFLEKHGPKYTRADVLTMAEGQMEAEKMAQMKASRIYFCDTDALNYRIWFDYRYGEVPDFVKDWITNAQYDYALLLYPDTPWKEDPLREYPDKRVFFFKEFEEGLNTNAIPFSIIKGKGNERFEKAIRILEKLLF